MNFVWLVVILSIHNISIYSSTPGNLTDTSICKVSHLGLEYSGHIAKTESKVRCQSWSSNQPHAIDSALKDVKFADGSRKAAKNYCRNPNNAPQGPWCYSMNTDLSFETCALPLCSFTQCKVTGPGIEYGGTHNKATSDRKCLKWDKERKKVRQDGKILKTEKFSNNKFPDENRSGARKYCRNPDGDLGGPWCFVEIEDSNEVEKEHCNIPFCDDPDCMVFSKNYDTYMHYTDFNESLTNLTFAVKLWDSDSYLHARGRIVLSLMALPLTGKEIEDLGVGIEILIGNNYSALTYGNKDKPEYEATQGVLKSTEYTSFSLGWHAGFISLYLEDQMQQIFLAEYKTKKNLMGFKMDTFKYYSVQGTNILWSFPFCMDDFECDVQTTTGKNFQQFWPLREKSLGYDLHIHLRAVHSASILMVPAPTIGHPYVNILLQDENNFTRVTVGEHKESKGKVLKELRLSKLLGYWEWREFTFTIFANTLQIYMKKAIGNHMLAEMQDEVFRQLRWFSVSSYNTVAQWSFFCVPPDYAKPPPAVLPECALNKEEPDYKGTQDITREGLPCLPWSGSKLLPTDVKHLFDEKVVRSEWNYCRDPSKEKKGTYCYAISLEPNKEIRQKYCRLRKCKSEQCKMAGTGNDYIGAAITTRSNRTCDYWRTGNDSVHHTFGKRVVWNDTLFADLSSENAKNFCRNPARDLTGSWCYTTDKNIVQDSCNIRDCDKPEECIIIISTTVKGRQIYVLPQWKETGIHGGLRFALKQWNPDFLEGIVFEIAPLNGTGEIRLTIGANFNEKIILSYNGKGLQEKTLPHLIPAGKWSEFWLQMRKGEVQLGLEGVPLPLFEWKHSNFSEAFEPMLVSYMSDKGKPVGIFFKCDECHTENVTIKDFSKIMPIGLWSEKELPLYQSVSIHARGTGTGIVRLMSMSSMNPHYLIKLDTLTGFVSFLKFDVIIQILAVSKPIPKLYTTTSWTKFEITFTETTLIIRRNDVPILNYTSKKPLLFYWFSIAAEFGWLTWSANCDPIDLDGPPRDGGWSRWSQWTCSVSCGGGEGFRTRTCSNPRPNLFGRLCQGSPMQTGKCNNFECGDVSPETLEKVRGHLQTQQFSFIVRQGSSQILRNDREILKKITKESPKAYYEWTLNGLLLKPRKGSIALQGDDIALTNVSLSSAGVYVCILFRISKKRVILRAASVAVVTQANSIVTRATRQFTLTCNSVVLGYIYTDLSLKVYLNNKIYKDHGTTVLAAVNAQEFPSLNESHSGDWKCVVQQKGLGLLWTTNYMRIQVKKAPNLYINLMEDKLTSPLFSWLKTETRVFYALILIVVGVFVIVSAFLVIYFKFCTLKQRSYKRNRK